MTIDRPPGWKWADLIPANGYGRCDGPLIPTAPLRKEDLS